MVSSPRLGTSECTTTHRTGTMIALVEIVSHVGLSGSVLTKQAFTIHSLLHISNIPSAVASLCNWKSAALVTSIMTKLSRVAISCGFEKQESCKSVVGLHSQVTPSYRAYSVSFPLRRHGKLIDEEAEVSRADNVRSCSFLSTINRSNSGYHKGGV